MFCRTLRLNKAKNSPFWMITFEGQDGRLRRRSTKVPHEGGMFEGGFISKDLAKRIAYQRGTMIALQEEREEEEQKDASLEAYVEECFRLFSLSVGEGSLASLRSKKKRLVDSLREVGIQQKKLRDVTRADVGSLCVQWRSKLSFVSGKCLLSLLSRVFKRAIEDDLCVKNPCAGVKIPTEKSCEKFRKEAFSMEEIRFMIQSLPPKWSAAVRICFETYGQRLMDVVSLRWEQVDWEKRVIHMITRKTGRVLEIPMRDSFYEWLQDRWRGARVNGEEFVIPALQGMTQAGLSMSFVRSVQALGIGQESCCKSGSRERVRHSKTFHSLRSSVATLLHASGVSQGFAMELVGHNSRDVHAAYLRPTTKQLLSAAQKLPNLENF